MIRDYLVPAIKARFPNQPFVFGEHPAAIATIEMPCGMIGPLEVCDDEDEATVFIGGATHGHFGCYDDALTPEEKQRKVSDDVIAFLEALMTDRVVVFRLSRGLFGGWKFLKNAERPSRSWIWEQFVWSRPL